jgi:hypothetical protein
VDNPWKIVSIIAILLLAGSVFFGLNGGYSWVAGSSLFAKNPANAPDIGQKAISYVNTNLISAGQNATLVNMTEVNGVYRVAMKVNTTGGQKSITVFITKDGTFLFPTYYNMTAGQQTKKTQAATVNATALLQQSCAAVKKQEAPELQAFVVSYCPYGTQMQAILISLINQVPGASKNIRVRYIGGISDGTITSMHGTTEAAENLRQICIREEQSDKYWDYVSCFITSKSSAACVKSAGVNNTTLTTCTGDSGRGLSYAREDFALVDAFGIAGSPTLVLNNMTVSEFSFGGRNAESIKKMLCCGSVSKPAYCSLTLNTSQQAIASGQC